MPLLFRIICAKVGDMVSWGLVLRRLFYFLVDMRQNIGTWSRRGWFATNSTTLRRIYAEYLGGDTV